MHERMYICILYVCVYVCVCIHVCMYVCVCVRVCVCVCIYIYIDLAFYILILFCVYKSICIYYANIHITYTISIYIYHANTHIYLFQSSATAPLSIEIIHKPDYKDKLIYLSIYPSICRPVALYILITAFCFYLSLYINHT